MQYEIKGSSRLLRGDAEVVHDFMQRCGKEGVPATPSALVDFARPADSPAHHMFDWDIARAAEEHWKATAAALIREVHVVYMRDPTDKPRTVRAFVSLENSDGRRGYLPTVDVLQSPEMRARLLENALGELRAFKRKYEDLHELAEVFEALERAQAA